MINVMLMHVKLPTNLWGEALLTACHVHNRIPSKKTKTSPYEIWKGRKPNLSYLRVWGCIAYYRVPDPKRFKLGPRALKSVFVGYAENSKAYRLLDKDSKVFIESRDVEFLETSFLENSNVNQQSNRGNVEPLITEDINKDQSSSLNNKGKQVEPPSESRRSQRVRKEKNLDSDFISSQAIVFLVEGSRDEILNKIPIVMHLEEDLKTYSNAMTSRDSSFWKEAINDEMDSLLSNGTWVLVDLPPSCKPIGCKWVFRRKHNTDGSLQTFKARLVAKGFRQKKRVDYFDTYASVARITSISVATPKPSPTRMASPNRNSGTLGLFLLFSVLLNFLFQKCRDPNPRPDPNGGSEPELGLLRRFHLSYQNVLLIHLVTEAVSVLGKPIIIYKFKAIR